MNITVISCIACFAFAPVIGLFAENFSIVSGTAAAKWCRTPKPLLGGISMFLAITVAMLFGEIPFGDHPILSCAGLFTSVGIIDDILTLSAGKKLLLQIGAAVLSLHFFFFLPFSVSFAAEVFWIVLFVNAFNLIDGMDGLAVSFSIIIFIWIALLGNPHIFSYAILGVCIGFLPYNFRNASLYLGDSGSHFLGSAIAVLVLQTQFNTADSSAFRFADFLPLLYPVSDILFVTITRLLRRSPVLKGGTDHIAHRLARLTSEKQSVFILLGFTMLCIAVSMYCNHFPTGNSLYFPLAICSFCILFLFWLQQKTNRYFEIK